MSANLPSVASDLLGWYDRHARELPWRAPPGTPPPDPYRVWLSEVMLQQTQVATVRPHFERWVARWPDFARLAAADDAEVMAAWAGLGYYARARNLLKGARAIVSDHGGRLPDSEAALRTIPGIGDYTAAAIAAIAFGRRAVVVDANVERVVARLAAIDTPLPAAKPAIRAATDAITPDAHAGDFAQAMMDLGSTICTTRAPRCLLCPIARHCRALAAGVPDRFPVKPTKRARPVRHGTMFWLERDGAVLLVRRPARGLLGGMRALPTGPWSDAPPGLADAPAEADWRISPATSEHGFTHFTLVSALASAVIDGHIAVADGEWWPIAQIESAGLPTVFAKAAAMFEGMRE
ncbi:A/G-specific adenine glycosylase [Sphingomonas baiyangensis]|uniref:Adenine DNA glycosylase n=1 Tax=Sphingomonas baiyangensis TaxID=2572576 RepID=A0A4V5PZ20_9SPHN|nr:A/G-specific adenine glycosylase [Sphingomonas baiyangensis]TKD53268.1 A/G-specific adenine glycosylase [Sphingomonas baiyangensis]